MSGTRGHSGRKRKPAATRYGEVWVRLSEVSRVTIGGISLVSKIGYWLVDGDVFHNYPSAAAEFVRRVNESRRTR